MAATRRVGNGALGLCEALRCACQGRQELLARWWSGGGFQEMVRALRSYGLDADEANDAAQQALIELWRFVARGKQVRSERHWIPRVLRNIASDVLRERSRATAPLPDDQLPPTSLVGNAHVSPCTEELAEAVLLIRSLPPPYAQIAELRYLDARPWAAVAAYLQRWSHIGGRRISENQVRWLINETRRMLRELGRGATARKRWPGRFSKKNHYTSTPAPPFEGDAL